MLEKEFVDRDPAVKFEDIVGLEQAKRKLQDYISSPQPQKGVLLYGYAGVGKKMLAKALAKFAKMTLISDNAFQKLSAKWRGELRNIIHYLFEIANFYAPTILFLGKIEKLVPKTDNNTSENSKLLKAEILERIY